MKFLACLLLLAAPAVCDTLYSFSGGFDYDATTGAFPELQSWNIYDISFSPVMEGTLASMEMTLDMIDNDGSGKPISAFYILHGFRPGDFGTFVVRDTQMLSGTEGYYGLPAWMTLTVTDPPPASDVPASLALVGLVAFAVLSLRALKLLPLRQE